MGSLTLDFDAYEFRCRCMNCIYKNGKAIDRELVDKLQIIRGIYNKPMPITSGVRCVKHNTFVGGAKASYHLPSQGALACDVGVTERMGRIIIIREALLLGLTVGLNNSFIHLDRRKLQRIFTY